MRSTFNIVIVDDLFSDEDDRYVIDAYMKHLKTIIENKGFLAKFFEFESPEAVLSSIEQQERKRIDLYISDNNLGDNHSEGIDFYLNLKKDFICDFILYTQSGVSGIIEKLKTDLENEQDPNLFSRFTFISRQTDNLWKMHSQEIISHIISKREEFNNLRGLFAQVTSKIHTHLASKIFGPAEEKRFSSTIEVAFRRGIIDSYKREQLHEIRLIRNALMHQDETKCPVSKKYFIEYKKPSFTRRGVEEGNPQKLYEDSNFSLLRQKLKNIERSILLIS